MEVSGQLHVLVALPPGQEHPAPIGQEVQWAQEPVWLKIVYSFTRNFKWWTMENCFTTDPCQNVEKNLQVNRY
jgi:hypothetical protein